MTQIESYRDLRVWQNAMDLCVALYKATTAFPSSEIYGLTSQMRRASVSIPSNIAEGYRRSRAEYIRFVSISRGSAAELDTQLELAYRIGLLPEDQYQTLNQSLAAVGRQLTALHNRLKETGTKA
ncbi:MAG: four helix bundle protein [Caldilineaceae bacterium]|nr:four helix bundle protein [Caldilineaceae bacterium]